MKDSHGTERDAALALRLIDLAPFVTLTVDDTGTVLWAAGPIERLFGMRPDEVCGTNVVDYVDAEWSPESLDSIGYALGASGLQRPMLFRLTRADGHRVVAEVTANAQMDDPQVAGLAVYARPWDERWLLDQTLDAIAGNVPLPETLHLLVRVMGAEILEGDGVVRYRDAESGEIHRCAHTSLGPYQRGELPLENAPWHRAMALNRPVSLPVAELDPKLAADAQARGHRWLWVWPVTVVGEPSPSACLSLWRRLDEPPDHTCRMSLGRLARLTSLLLARDAAAMALRRAAHFDALTDLANRSAFFAELDSRIADHAAGPLIGLVYVDLDGFKEVNDRLGHTVGDAVLVEVARRLRDTVRPEDVVARIGGDEFTILCPSMRSRRDLERLGEQVLEVLMLPIDTNGHAIRIGASVGLSAIGPEGCSVDELVDAADQAMYQAKGSRPGGCHFRSP